MLVAESDVPSSPGPQAAAQPGALPTPDGAPARRWSRGPFVVLALAIVWIGLVRVPLILNARAHLDSDLAVDGLALREAVRGHWRWHYPGTPHVGILPVLYSWPQAALWGTNARTLVSGGTVSYIGLVAATFAFTWRVFGRSTALWGLVPLTFASTGAVWLSGRITGGHLTAALWHAIAFLLFHVALTRGGPKAALALGFWCGLGLYLDSMFLLTLTGLIAAGVGWWWLSGKPRPAPLAALLVLLGFLAGIAPREVGARVDPYNAYPAQFEPTADTHQLLFHLRLLGLDCLPRLIAGHRLPDLQADPDPSALGGPGSMAGARDASTLAISVTVVLVVVFLAAVRALADPESTRHDPAATAIRIGLLVSAVVNLVAFVLNKHIYNPDNYRYLVDLLVPWSVGFGLSMRSLVRLGRGGVVVACLCSAVVAVLMTLDTARWYHRFGWLDAKGQLVMKRVEDPVLDWLNEHREVDAFYSGYWDVYRYCFLAKRPLKGIPYPVFPNRYPEWSRGLPGGRPQILIARRFSGSRWFFERAVQEGGQVLDRGSGFVIASWPIP